MSRIFIYTVILVLASSCGVKKTIYVASTLADCENNLSQKCLQIKENKEDEWTILNNDIEDFEYKDGVEQKIEVTISKVKNPPISAPAFNYKFVKLIYEEEKKLEEAMDVPFTLVLDKNYDGKWQVHTMIGMDSLTKLPTLIFKDSKISGNAGCNNYGATYVINGNQITFGLTHATKMYCPDNMKIEKVFFACLAKTKTYKTRGSELIFYDLDNAELLRFNSIDEK